MKENNSIESFGQCFNETLKSSNCSTPSSFQWRKTIPEQAGAIRYALISQPGAVTSKQVAKNFSRAELELRTEAWKGGRMSTTPRCEITTRCCV